MKGVSERFVVLIIIKNGAKMLILLLLKDPPFISYVVGFVTSGSVDLHQHNYEITIIFTYIFIVNDTSNVENILS